MQINLGSHKLLAVQIEYRNSEVGLDMQVYPIERRIFIGDGERGPFSGLSPGIILIFKPNGQGMVASIHWGSGDGLVRDLAKLRAFETIV